MSTYERSVALEEVWTGSPAGAPLIPTLGKQVGADLREFLQTRQDGTRAVTRSMIDRVLTARVGQMYSTPTTVRPERHHDFDTFDPIFGEIPGDTGHWGLRYFEHALNPLRNTLPAYAHRVMAGEFEEDRLASNLPSNVAGVVVVRVPQDE
ncbi:hypothetical protein ACWEKT_29560 [Nocardia takedensis]